MGRTIAHRAPRVREDSGMSHLMRAQLGFCPKVTRHESFDESSARILCGSREPKLQRVASKSAGSTASPTPPFRRVRLRYQRHRSLGQVWLPKQHHRFETPRSRGVGTPRVCRPADYLPSGTVGQWPPATGQWWNERRDGDPKTDRATQRGGDPKTD